MIFDPPPDIPDIHPNHLLHFLFLPVSYTHLDVYKRQILDTIAEATALRVANQKKLVSPKEMQEAALRIAKAQQHRFPFEQALLREDINFICEVKKASPSKGIIAEDFPYVRIAREYEQAGAAAISVLTEPRFFLGKDEYLEEIVNAVSIPVLRKDFTIDPYQIYQAKTLGASAVLLICALLERPVLREYPVPYTHLDVYKRQLLLRSSR